MERRYTISSVAGATLLLALIGTVLAAAPAQAQTGPLCAGETVTVELSKGETTTNGRDVILGTNGADVIGRNGVFIGDNDIACLLGGNDELHLGSSNSQGFEVHMAAGADLVTGSAGGGNATVTLGPGDDTVNLSLDSGALRVVGGVGNDTIRTGAGVDTIWGGPGNDTLDGRGSNDTILGQDGNDRLAGENGDDTIRGGHGNDFLWGHAGADVLQGEAGDDTIRGYGGADRLFGGDGHDTIHGNGGDDEIFGQGGDDDVDGGVGNDTIRGNDGNDTISGNEGDDNINGNDGNDTIVGDNGDDTIGGADGHDFLDGSDGDDTIVGGNGNDRLRGGAGADVLNGWDGNDRLAGQAGDDQMWGGSGLDKIWGGIGDDSIIGNGGSDEIYGGDGQDTVKGGDGADTIFGGAGSDELYGDDGDDTVRGSAGNDTLYGGDNDDDLDGDDGDDSLHGDSGADSVNGNAGNDTVSGGPGNDRLAGEDGNDVIIGGTGRDLLWGHAGNDQLVGGSGNDDLLGYSGDDILQGGNGADRLWGHNGNDDLFGGAGDNELFGGNGADVCIAADSQSGCEFETRPFGQAPPADFAGTAFRNCDTFWPQWWYPNGVSPDDHGVEKYVVTVNGSVWAEFGPDSYIPEFAGSNHDNPVVGLERSTSYVFTVTAIDFDGNETVGVEGSFRTGDTNGLGGTGGGDDCNGGSTSAQPPTASPDTTPPEWRPGWLQTIGVSFFTPNKVHFNWQRFQDWDGNNLGAVSHFEVFLDGEPQQTFSISTWRAAQTYDIDQGRALRDYPLFVELPGTSGNRPASGSVEVGVIIVDTAGNQSSMLTGTIDLGEPPRQIPTVVERDPVVAPAGSTPTAPPDPIAPNVGERSEPAPTPACSVAVNVLDSSRTSVYVSWTALNPDTDLVYEVKLFEELNDGVDRRGYRRVRTVISPNGATEVTIRGLQPLSGRYFARVTAFDADGNVSAPCDSAQIDVGVPPVTWPECSISVEARSNPSDQVALELFATWSRATGPNVTYEAQAWGLTAGDNNPVLLATEDVGSRTEATLLVQRIVPRHGTPSIVGDYFVTVIATSSDGRFSLCSSGTVTVVPPPFDCRDFDRLDGFGLTGALAAAQAVGRLAELLAACDVYLEGPVCWTFSPESSALSGTRFEPDIEICTRHVIENVDTPAVELCMTARFPSHPSISIGGFANLDLSVPNNSFRQSAIELYIPARSPQSGSDSPTECTTTTSTVRRINVNACHAGITTGGPTPTLCGVFTWREINLTPGVRN